MRLLKQDKDYNCGVYALHFLLSLSGIKYYAPSLEDAIEPNQETGTSHHQITTFMTIRNIKHHQSYNNKSDELKYPCMVNYQYDSDGHYGVALCKTSAGVVLYNPANGQIEIVPNFDKVFYSERYGKGWSLYLL